MQGGGGGERGEKREGEGWGESGRQKCEDEFESYEYLQTPSCQICDMTRVSSEGD